MGRNPISFKGLKGVWGKPVWKVTLPFHMAYTFHIFFSRQGREGPSQQFFFLLACGQRPNEGCVL
jgi:hypothetical protein